MIYIIADWQIGRFQIADWNSTVMRNNPMVLAQPICKLL
jgi:hypothetical protein